jgi:hypothetical protein
MGLRRFDLRTHDQMLLVEKGISEFEHVSANVLKGEPRMPEHHGDH